MDQKLFRTQKFNWTKYFGIKIFHYTYFQIFSLLILKLNTFDPSLHRILSVAFFPNENISIPCNLSTNELTESNTTTNHKKKANNPLKIPLKSLEGPGLLTNEPRVRIFATHHHSGNVNFLHPWQEAFYKKLKSEKINFLISTRRARLNFETLISPFHTTRWTSFDFSIFKFIGVLKSLSVFFKIAQSPQNLDWASLCQILRLQHVCYKPLFFEDQVRGIYSSR